MRFTNFFLILLLLSIPLRSMDNGDHTHLSPENEKAVLLPPVGRLKKVALMALSSAQKTRYGQENISESTQQIIDQLELDPSLKNSLSFKRMNSATRNMLKAYGEDILGMKSLLGERTIWINEEDFSSCPPTTQSYLITKGISQTDYCNPELKGIIAGELCGMAVSYSIFQKAKMLIEEMKDNKVDDPTMNRIKSLLFWKDKSGLMRAHPNLLRITGWSLAMVTPLIVLPVTPIEKISIDAHRHKAILLSSSSHQSFLRMREVVDETNFNDENSSGLSQDELDFLKRVVTKKTKQDIEESIQHTLAEEPSCSEKFNFYTCIHSCEGKECDCRKLFRDHEEYKKLVKDNSYLDLCAFNAVLCKTECNRNALRYPRNITKQIEKKTHE